ncbi:hypothetical protein PoB_006696200 [Plakobranchus ocellatus]|uniref:Uncharacterized protein n=1 Tax=Plakobranchus ocellatus TaxID=259542 RepID=A0AAV4D892_9GAST|nr:hypothetical protein PoB_006696200 [Plakobranchus ocellatus]
MKSACFGKNQSTLYQTVIVSVCRIGEGHLVDHSVMVLAALRSLISAALGISMINSSDHGKEEAVERQRLGFEPGSKGSLFLARYRSPQTRSSEAAAVIFVPEVEM